MSTEKNDQAKYLRELVEEKELLIKEAIEKSDPSESRSDKIDRVSRELEVSKVLINNFLIKVHVDDKLNRKKPVD